MDLRFKRQCIRHLRPAHAERNTWQQCAKPDVRGSKQGKFGIRVEENEK
jgi:hypothetical protein